ncbi:MAG: hypothetical protein JSV91_03715 [Phycisphaerales bacterium]|nr:MAG: hypothetical protein JSV91_03715 [Phycisphaerales bacterium]
MSQSSVLPTLAHAVIRDSVHCRSCGYNLRGLAAGGRCPECGSEIWQSVLHTVDPAASRLPKLVNPNRVGTSLLWLMGCLFLAGLLLTVFALAIWLEETRPSIRSPLPGFLTQRELPLAAAAAAFASLLGVWGLAYPQGPDPTGAVRRDLRLMALGLTVWALVLLVGAVINQQGLIPSFSDAVWPALGLASDIGAVIGLMGMRGVLLAIGLRSREYRNARGARQGMRAMIAAVCTLAAGQFLQLLDRTIADGLPLLPGIAQMLVAISTLMLVIGMAYLVVNAWWIRSSLRKPPPALEDVLLPPEPPDRHAPMAGGC